MKSSFLPRIRLFSVFIIVFALVLLSKLFFVQVVYGGTFEEKGDNQYTLPESYTFDRGSIFLSAKDNSRVSAATVTTGFKLAIDPREIKNKEELYQKLSEVIALDKEEFLKAADKKDDPYEEVAHRLSKEEADKIRGLNLDGVSLYKEKWRFYPGGALAAQTIGFVAFSGDDLSGRYGLERFYNRILTRGETGPYINPFAEIFGNFGSLIFKNKRMEGNIITSIEPTVESMLEEELKGVVERWGAEQAGGVIIDPKDGTIYALAHSPSFDLNKFREVEEVSLFSNPLVESVFEFGSIMKPLTMASALDAGAVTRDTTYNDRGFVEIDGEIIHNFDKKGRGVVSMQEVLNQSLNTGAVFAMQELGKDNFRDYILSFGIGDKTGIDLPAEISGLVSNLESGRKIESATASFGQGIAITPIEAARAFSVLANGGKLIRPHIVKEIEYENGIKEEISFEQGPQIIKEATAEEITSMLVEVVDDALTKIDKSLSFERYSIAAKTGTAQIADTQNGGYFEDRFLHSFFGYFPAYNPRFLVLLYLEHPKGVRFASQTLASPFMDIAKFLINYYQIPPDR